MAEAYMKSIYIAGMTATALAMTLFAAHPLSGGAQEAQAEFNEAGELAQVAKFSDSLDDEGRKLLNEFVQILPKLDVKKVKAETAGKFPLALLEKIKADFDANYAPYKIGEIITVATRVKIYTGPFGGMREGKMLVGNNLVPTIDLMQETLDKANPEVISEKRRAYLKKNYYDLKAAYMLKAKEALFADRLEKLGGFYNALAQEHAKGRLQQPEKAGDNVNVATCLPLPKPAAENTSEQQNLPGQNSPSLASDNKENLN